MLVRIQVVGIAVGCIAHSEHITAQNNVEALLLLGAYNIIKGVCIHYYNIEWNLERRSVLLNCTVARPFL